MTELEKSTEGIVLASMPFKDYDRLVHIISPEYGILKFYVRGALRPKSRFFGLLEPLTHADFIFKSKRGEFSLLLEGKLKNPYLEIREDYDRLICAFECLKSVLKTQAIGHACFEVFALLKSYLNQLKTFKQPKKLVSSFYIKLLLIEGLFNLKNKCTRCKQIKDPLFFTRKDYYCRDCCFDHSLSFSQEELTELLELLKMRSFDLLKNCSLSESLHIKTKKLYEILYEV